MRCVRQMKSKMKAKTATNDQTYWHSVENDVCFIEMENSVGLVAEFHAYKCICNTRVLPARTRIPSTHVRHTIVRVPHTIHRGNSHLISISFTENKWFD